MPQSQGGDSNTTTISPDEPLPPASPKPTPSRLPRTLWFLAGGTGRPPTTARFVRMARERRQQEAAAEAWKAARRQALDDTGNEWGGSGLSATVRRMLGVAGRPKDLRRWHREWEKKKRQDAQGDDDGKGVGERDKGQAANEGDAYGAGAAEDRGRPS
ncbi:hypothetical protein NKR23_g91 [Pleurostoma richardsiae]|uniref:Uncharacterized protein n=1 Tax=Pleurostoma richardsiae TaxID=41990 RepID=A0AA38RTD8_9PEZI|nr:hypothetical protein NKR23_g91 [Pleurostoma richardsiae]